MPPRTDIILFGDIETTGVEEDLDSIIEVGLSLWSWPGWEEIAYVDTIVTPTAHARARMAANPVVSKMHKENGLAAEIDDLLTDPKAMERCSPEAIDTLIHDWLAGWGTTHIPIGGSGWGHFDRRFTKKYLPKFERHLTYWVYDVGVPRRMFEMVGAPILSDDKTGKTHRAIDDARLHAAEFKYYSDMFKAFVPQVVTSEMAAHYARDDRSRSE